MAKTQKEILRELVEEVLDEMTGTGGVAGYSTPNAFRGKKSNKAAAERSMPGGKVVGEDGETDDTTINEDGERLPILRRSLTEGLDALSWILDGMKPQMSEKEVMDLAFSNLVKYKVTQLGDETIAKDSSAKLWASHDYEFPKHVRLYYNQKFGEGRNESVNEGRYRNFRKDESMKSHTKVCFGISEAKKMLREVEFLVSIVERLKSEDGVDKSQLWKRTKKDLNEINKRTKAIARRVYRIGKQ